jgi:hypothetical protein
MLRDSKASLAVIKLIPKVSPAVCGSRQAGAGNYLPNPETVKEDLK